VSILINDLFLFQKLFHRKSLELTDFGNVNIDD